MCKIARLSSGLRMARVRRTLPQQTIAIYYARVVTTVVFLPSLMRGSSEPPSAHILRAIIVPVKRRLVHNTQVLTRLHPTPGRLFTSNADAECHGTLLREEVSKIPNLSADLRSVRNCIHGQRSHTPLESPASSFKSSIQVIISPVKTHRMTDKPAYS